MRFLWKILCKNGRLFVILCIFMFFCGGTRFFPYFTLNFADKLVTIVVLTKFCPFEVLYDVIEFWTAEKIYFIFRRKSKNGSKSSN